MKSNFLKIMGDVIVYFGSILEVLVRRGEKGRREELSECK